MVVICQEVCVVVQVRPEDGGCPPPAQGAGKAYRHKGEGGYKGF